MRVTRILFPTDFSSGSEAARRVAVDMARETGASLHLVHVVPPAISRPCLVCGRASDGHRGLPI